MVGNGGYERLAMPSHPPGYEELEAQSADMATELLVTMEQFEIDDYETYGPESSDGFFRRASSATKRMASRFNHRVIHPVTNIIDPIYEGYKHLLMIYERTINKIGNPLVVKRLLYVFFVIAFLVVISRYTTSEGVNGALGGAFSNGKFYDQELLGRATRDFIDDKAMKVNIEYLSSMPHIAGSKGDLALAKYVQSYMRNNGINVLDFNQLEGFINYPIFSPQHNYLKLEDNSFEATLTERNDHDMQYVAYNPNALTMNEELVAPYIYIGHGTPEDYDNIKDIKTDGAIALVKYGGSLPEPNKVLLAQQHGFKGVVFITPEITIQGKKHDDVIQKKNVALTRINAGDVLTPGWPADDRYVTRLPWLKSDLTPKIPTVPISWKDGKHLLKQLKGGHKFVDGFHSGETSPQKLKLMVKHEERPLHDIWNIIGSISGRDQIEKGVIIGAARDSSCYGTLSANTGTAVLLELVKVFTLLQRRYNWLPSRSIYFISFDATAYNLEGAGEWIESKKHELKEQGYAYIDLSDAVSGDNLEVRANPFFHELVRDALKKVDDGSSNLFEKYKKQNGGDQINYTLIQERNYLPFVNLINMPALEIKFTGEYPQDTCYDDFDNLEASGIDPKMTRHKQLTELLSLIVLELAESPILPYSFRTMASEFARYRTDLEQYINDKVAQDTVKPNMHYDGLDKAAESLVQAGKRFHAWVDGWKLYVQESGDLEPSLLAMNRYKWNDNIVRFNTEFLNQDIQLKRPGYANLLFGVPFNAPPHDDGKYHWNTFPLVRDYVDAGDYTNAQKELERLATVVAQACQKFTEY